MKVYIANLGKYNEGETIGAWFNLPINYDEMKEKIGLNAGYEEYAIHDYELPFDVSEYTPIQKLNDLAVKVRDIEGTPIYHELKAINSQYFGNLEELLEKKEDILHYDYDSMEDLARNNVIEGMYGEIPSRLQYYIEYERLGRDMELEGNYLVTSHGIFNYNG